MGSTALTSMTAKTMTARYLVALGFIALVSLGSFGVLQANIRSGRASASVINLSGRQRMLSQRVAQYALRMALAPTASAEARTELSSAVELLATAHAALLEAAVAQGKATPSAAVLAMYLQEPVNVDAQIKSYLGHARRVLSANPLELTNPDLQALLGDADTLLRSLDAVVTQYELEAEHSNAALSTWAAAILAATLLTLALIALFVFKPMTAAVERAAADRTRLLRAAETELHRSEVLYKIADTVSRAENVQSVLKDIVAETSKALKADRVLLVTVDTAARSLSQVEVGGLSAARVPPVTFEELWEGLSGWVLQNGETAHSPAGFSDPRESERTAATRFLSDSAEVLVAPLQVQGLPFGTLTAIRDPGAATFNAAETALLTAVANQAAVALRSALASAERDRLASEFEAIFNAIPDAVLFADAERRVRLVNPATEKVFGYAQAALQGQPTSLLYAATEDYDRQGSQRYHGAAAGTSHYEMCYRAHDGREFLGETVGSAVRDRAGALLGYMGIIRDVTEVRRAERERLGEQAFLQAVLESVDDGIVACDASGHLTLFNRASRELHGLSANARLEPEHWANHYDLYQADGVTPLSEAEIPLMRAFRGEERVDAELVITPTDASPRILKARGRALYDADGVKLGAVVAMHDLSEQRRVEGENRQWLERVRLLYDVSTQNELSAYEQIGSALALSAKLLELDLGVLSRVEGERYTVTHLYDETATLQVGAVFNLKKTYCHLTLREGDVLGIHHMAEDARSAHPCYAAFGLEAYIGIPVTVGGEAWGVLSFSSGNPHPAFTSADFELLRLLGQFVSAALERQASNVALQHYADELAHSNRALEQRNRNVGLLSSMSELLQAAGNFTEAFSVVEHYAKALFAPLQGGLLWADGETLTSALVWGGASTPSAELTDCWALRLGRPHRAAESGGPRCAHSEAGLSSLCVPLSAHNETLGIFYLQAALATDLSSEAERLALAFTEGLAVTLANLKLRESLQQQSIRDPLTDLFNRRYLEETLERELHRSVRAGRPLSFVMFDIDHFKTFNDTFGHEAGDLVLREIAHLASTTVRKEDIVCRYGGEEFALILPDAPEGVAWERAEKLRVAASELELAFGGQQLGRVTLSLGVVTVLRGGDLGRIVGLSDAALYAAKRGGRNQVKVAGLPSEGLLVAG